jgi:hypothetical protein
MVKQRSHISQPRAVQTTRSRSSTSRKDPGREKILRALFLASGAKNSAQNPNFFSLSPSARARKKRERERGKPTRARELHSKQSIAREFDEERTIFF